MRKKEKTNILLFYYFTRVKMFLLEINYYRSELDKNKNKKINELSIIENN